MNATLNKRKVVKIDEEKCNGCGICVSACHEGAIELVDGKAKLIEDKLCDGLGDCLSPCPQGAITIEEREAEEYDSEAVKEHLSKTTQDEKEASLPPHGCPSMRQAYFEKDKQETFETEQKAQPSMLSQWPIQLTLLNPMHPALQGPELLLVADCVPFAHASFHQDFLKGKPLAIACPKLDNVAPYIDKLAEVFSQSAIKKITIVHMEVPCCFGLRKIVEEALAKAHKDIPTEHVVITVKGQVKDFSKETKDLTAPACPHGH